MKIRRMKSISIISLVAFFGAWPAVAGVARQAEDPGVLLRAAIEKEEVEGDLQGAIALYRQIVEKFGDQRTVAAKALLRLGGCHEKLGQAEARKVYERLLRDYSDQSGEATAARSRLAALDRPAVRVSSMATRKVWAGPKTDFFGAVSPDAKYISFVDWETGDLAVRDLEKATNRRLTNKGSWESNPNEEAELSIWSPDSRQIAYQWSSMRGYELRIIGLDNPTPRVLYEPQSLREYMEPLDWSPDGRHILAVVYNEDANQRMVLLSVADGTIRTLKELPVSGGVYCAAISPDGRWILYDCPQNESSLARDIFLLPFEGGRETPLVEYPADDLALGWTPDGKWVLFASDRRGSVDVWAVRTEDGKPQGEQVMLKPAVGRIHPLGLTRSGALYFGVGGGQNDVYVAKMDPVTGDVPDSPNKLVKQFEGYNRGPRYSPDGKFLAYLSKRAKAGLLMGGTGWGDTLCIRSLETGEEREYQREMIRLGVRGFGNPRWSPDGRSMLLYGRDGRDLYGIYHVNLETGEARNLLLSQTDLFIGPAEGWMDGKHFFYVRWDRKNDRSDICIWDLDSGDERVLCSSSPPLNGAMAVSPDGRWISTLDRPGTKDGKVLSIISTDSGMEKKLIKFSKEENAASIRHAWAADSRYIYYVRRVTVMPASSKFQVWRMPIDGGLPQQTGLEMSGVIDHISAHPDGTHLAFENMAPMASSPAEVWVLENFLPAAPPAPKARQDANLIVRRIPKLDMYAKPSPDGKYIAHVDWSSGNLAILEVATGVTRLLTKDAVMGANGSMAGFCAWSRDSKRIAYQWLFWRPDKRGQELRVLSLEDDSTPSTVNLPDGTFAGWVYDWASDGTRILCELSSDGGRSSEPAIIDVVNNRVELINPDLKPLNWVAVLFMDEDDSILFSRPFNGAGTSHDIYIGNLKTGETRTIVSHPAEDLVVGMLPGTDWLLFASNRRGSLDLWGVRFRNGQTAGQPLLVKQGIGRFFPLGFTKGGSYYYATLSVADDVFFADFDPETDEIVGEPQNLVSPWEGTNMDPSFSPDGGSIAYVTKRSPLPVPVHVADSLVVQSLKDPKADPVVIGFEDLHLNRVADPIWEAGGKSLVVVGWLGDLKELYRVDLSTKGKAKIFSPPDGYRADGHLCGSKTGSIYFIYGAAGQQNSVVQVDSDGKNMKELFPATQGEPIMGIAISPDEKTLSIITHTDTYQRKLWVMPAAGGEARLIHEFRQPSSGGVSHMWSPDGKSIFYIVNEKEKWTWGIHRIPAEGGAASKTVLKIKNPFHGMVFHPNGRMIAFTGRSGASSDSEVWAMDNLLKEIKMQASDRESR